jgi:hypothetical protein
MSTDKIPLPSIPETAVLGITVRGSSSKTAALPECRSRRSPPPADLRRLLRDRHQRALPECADTGTTAPITTNIPRASGSGTPIVTCICWNHRILPISASANQQNPRTKFLFVCFSGRILSISIFSQNPSWSKMKFPSWSKLFSCFGGCLPCSKCSTNVSCCGTRTITNNYGGQESESQASASKQAALPDLISM